MFTTLEQSAQGRRRSGAAFLCGVLAQAMLIGAAVFLGLIFPDELPIGEQRYVRVWLSALQPPQKAVVNPPRPTVRVVVPQLRLQKAPEPLELPPPTVARLEAPKIQPTIPPPPIHEASVPAPHAAPPLSPPKERLEVHTGLFGGGAPERVTTRRPVEQVQTGGFGSPQGLPGRARGESLGNVPKLGSFGLPEGPGVGNGTGGAKGIQGVVASADFGNRAADPGDGHGRAGVASAPVALGGFAKAQAEAPTPASLHVPPPPALEPVEILSKPSPIYTEEARRSGIQGDVTLSVVFLATGAVQVVGVIRSLGHGLDEAAEQAALQIRFKPAQRDGKPADFPASLRIEFRLADQSTHWGGR
jgi:TonB family protein